MQYTQEQLLEHLQKHEISYQLYTHAPVFTCEQALEITEQMNIPGAGIKNLFLKDRKKKLYLIVAINDTRVELKTIGNVLEAKELRFADATLLMNHLGVEPGSVTPLALINDPEHKVQLILDATILTQDFIQIHPLQNSATVAMTPADLMKFLGLMDRSYIVYDFNQNKVC